MTADDQLLRGRAAVVTGASRGIGLAIARALAGAGARVAMLARTADVLAERAKEIGDRAVAIPCDVSDADALGGATRTITNRVGAPDIIVNNAGLFAIAPLHSTDVEMFARTIDVNLVAPFRLVRAFLGAMRERKSGHLVTIGSIADHMIFPENGAYNASKYGARAIHEVLLAELRGSGVRATLVSPGPVDTSLWDAIGPDDRPGFTPRAQMLAPEAVAEAVLWAVTRPPEVNVAELRISRS